MNPIILSGFSGAGKSTLEKRLVKSGQVVPSISVTTRKPRKGEKDGVNYFFVSEEKFESMSKNGEFLEETTYCGNRYGTPMSQVAENNIFVMDVSGALHMKRMFPYAITIFVAAPKDELERRLSKRGLPSKERLEHMVTDASCIPYFDYLVVNCDLDEAQRDIEAIIRAEKLKPDCEYAKKIFKEGRE